MRTKLLKKIKKDWKIIRYVDPEMNYGKGGEIFRALYKGKLVPYAHINTLYPDNYRMLILAIAYKINFKFYDLEDGVKAAQEKRLIKKRRNTPQELAIKKAKQIWP